MKPPSYIRIGSSRLENGNLVAELSMDWAAWLRHRDGHEAIRKVAEEHGLTVAEVRKGLIATLVAGGHLTTWEARELA